MSTTTLIVKFPKELIDQVDLHIQARLKNTTKARPTQAYWAWQTLEGKAFMRGITSDRKYTHMPIDKVNAIVRTEYLKFAGPPKFGRKPIVELRTKFLVDSIAEKLQRTEAASEEAE